VTELRSADIVMVRGEGWFSKGIRWASRGVGEARTEVSHVGQVVIPGGLYDAMVAEALGSGVRIRPLGAYAGKKSSVAIYRPHNITLDQSRTITRAALEHAGDKYGWGKIALQLLDSKLLRGSYFFRRLARIEKRPICSYLVAMTFAEAGLDFGVEPRMAQPDDIWDFCVRETDKYVMVRELMPIPAAGEG
jgi:hypothetical protein